MVICICFLVESLGFCSACLASLRIPVLIFIKDEPMDCSSQTHLHGSRRAFRGQKAKSNLRNPSAEGDRLGDRSLKIATFRYL